MSDFFAMGDYGAYVWTAYGITLVGLIALFLWSWFGARARESELEQVRHWARAERRAPTAAAVNVVSPNKVDTRHDTDGGSGADAMPAADASGSGA